MRHRPRPQGRLHQLADPVHGQNARAVPAEDRLEQEGSRAGCHHGAGVDLKLVADQLGHCSIVLTADTYVVTA